VEIGHKTLMFSPLITYIINMKIIIGWLLLFPSFLSALDNYNVSLSFKKPSHFYTADILNSNFGVVFSPADLANTAKNIPDVRTPQPVFDKSDFSDFPDYSFSYNNKLIVKAIDAAQKSLDVAMYSISLDEMVEAILRANARGVRIRMIINHFHVYPRPTAQIKKLIENGINIRTLRGERSYGVMHNKITIVDGGLLITGSYNWTFGATFFNLENQIIARNPIYLRGYKKYFSWMWKYAHTIEQGPQDEVEQDYYGKPPQEQNSSMDLNGYSVPAYIFSPNSDAGLKLAEIISKAKKTIDAVTFTFSSRKIADALIEAKNRGVKVRFMTDKKIGQSSAMAKYLYDSGVEFRWRRGRVEKGAMHNKFIILDGKILQTGSFNWTLNADWNSFENMIFTDDSGAINAYARKYNWFYSEAEVPVPGDFQIENTY